MSDDATLITAGEKVIDILLVEDNPGDQVLTMEAFRTGKIRNTINICGDGEEALDYLHRRGPHAGASRPDLILLDLNLPLKDGREVLADIKGDPDLRRIPVIVLTTSRLEEDVLRCYDLNCNAYITKPVDMVQFIDVVAALEGFWFKVVKLPG